MSPMDENTHVIARTDNMAMYSICFEVYLEANLESNFFHFGSRFRLLEPDDDDLTNVLFACSRYCVFLSSACAANML